MNLFLLLPFCLSGSVAAADYWVEVQLSDKETGLSKQLKVGASGEHWFAFGQTGDSGYQQLYTGPRFAPKEWLEVGVGLGAETVGDDWDTRFASYIWVGAWPWSTVAVYEDGDLTGPWHKVQVTHNVTTNLSLGVQNKKYLGTGPFVTYKVTEHLLLWGNALAEGGQTTSQFGLKFTF